MAASLEAATVTTVAEEGPSRDFGASFEAVVSSRSTAPGATADSSPQAPGPSARDTLWDEPDCPQCRQAPARRTVAAAFPQALSLGSAHGAGIDFIDPEQLRGPGTDVA